MATELIPKEELKVPLDELSNEELKAYAELYPLTAVLVEQDRVEQVISRRVLCGDDLTYWFTRAKVLHAAARR